MLVPAQLYHDELKRELIARWYEPRYSHYFAGERGSNDIADNAFWRRDFVYLDEDNKLAGYFGYAFNETSKSMINFGLIGFKKNNTRMIREVLCHVRHMFKSGQAQRADFIAFADNPACKLYRRFAAQYGGDEVAHLHRVAYYDGSFHDTVMWEFLAENVLAALE